MEQFSINEYKNNPERSVMTRNGLDVRIVCTDFKAMGCPDKNSHRAGNYHSIGIGI